MNKESVLYGIIGLLAGVVIAGFTVTSAVNSNNQGMMQMMGMHTNTNKDTDNDNDNHGMMKDSDMTMGDMTAALKNKTGDDFDKAFLSEMITHHQGAIDMANLAKQNAKHDEIKNLANDIISAQTSEITQMQSWQQQWGYGATSSPSGMHGMMQ